MICSKWDIIHCKIKRCVLCAALPVVLQVVRGPERLPADDELQEMLRGKLRILQADSTEVNALFMVQLMTHTHLAARTIFRSWNFKL